MGQGENMACCQLGNTLTAIVTAAGTPTEMPTSVLKPNLESKPAMHICAYLYQIAPLLRIAQKLSLLPT